MSLHHSARPSHYDQESESYDDFNEKTSASTNRLIEKILKKYKVKTVLDLTCGTGSQVFWLAKRGYRVTGSDINKKMLNFARTKVKRAKIDIRFLEGDMRTLKVGVFDAALTIYNAVGHLTKADFEKAMRNIHRNLKKDGLYIFDIFNLDYLKADGRITQLTIDWVQTVGDTHFRKIQYSTIDLNGILASYTTSLKQRSSGKSKTSQETQTLQVYTAKQLQNMLARNGFRVVSQCAIDGSKFSETQTDRILTIAKKMDR